MQVSHLFLQSCHGRHRFLCRCFFSAVGTPFWDRKSLEKKFRGQIRYSARTRVIVEEKTVRIVQRMKNPAARLLCPASGCPPGFFDSSWPAAVAGIAPKHPENHITGNL